MEEGETRRSGVLSLTGEKKDIMRFAGAWKHLKEDEVKDMEKRIDLIRRRSTRDLLKKLEKNDLS